MSAKTRPPTALERRRRPITAKGRETFLAALAAGWSVQAAADRAGWHRSRFYALRESDESFAQEWDEAIEAGCDVLEDALRVAASEGWDELTFDGKDVLIRGGAKEFLEPVQPPADLRPPRLVFPD